MTILHTPDGLPVRSDNRLPVELYGPDGAVLFGPRRLAADNLALPNAPDVLATLLGYDGTNLDLLRVDGSKNLLASLRTADGKEDLYTGSGGSSSTASADTVTSGYARRQIEGFQRLFDGTSWQAQRANVEGTLLASAARTGTTIGAQQTNHNARGVLLLLDVTANPGGAETLSIQIRAYTPAAPAQPRSIFTTPTLFTATNGIAAIYLYPGTVETVAATTFEVNGVPLPRSWDAAVLHSAGGSWTYSLGYSLIN